ncbi:WAT1-related protein [Zea mays]|uniref:WAT1-related protein n=1 Tax=Zea mays TaxID=4577 RepID=A0A3L6DI37_MAIZE|nr:WAT1-related protein [Zea mays]
MSGMAARIGEWKPVMAMLVFDLISAVTTALIKKALQEGLDRLVLITLRQLVATVFLAPIAYFRERSTRPKLTLEILVYLFFSAAFGAALSQYTFFYGLQYTTATFAITFTNVAPVLTFLIAVLLRVESLSMKNKAGAAKIAGTLTSFAGVMLLTLYKGVSLTHQQAGEASPEDHNLGAAAASPSDRKSWTLGTLALLANCLCFSFWLLLQSRLTKKYPALYSSTAYMFLISSMQGGALTAAIQRRASVWLLTRPIEIVTVLYTGIMGSGVGYVLMTWCVEKRGPVFTSAFIPVIQIMVAMVDFFFLHENLYLGSVLGSILLILGLYILLWGKKRDASSSAAAKEEEDGEKEDEEEEDKEKQLLAVAACIEMWMISAGRMEQWAPTAAMVATNVVIAVMTALIKQALSLGMNRLVLITFRQMVATLFLGPIAYFKERRMRPKFTSEIFVYMFLSGILGPVLLQYTLFVGLDYTTATFAATFGNMLPVVTFLISLAFRLAHTLLTVPSFTRFEALEVKSKSGSAKISGTLISLGGAMMLTFYKGSALTQTTTAATSSPASSGGGHIRQQAGEHGTVRWVLGSVSMLANVVGFALWLLLQRKFTRKYPAVYSATAFMSLFSFVQAGALALSIQRTSLAVWALRGTVEIATVVYCGVVASGIGYLLLTYCVEKRGPVFTAAFSPLAQIFVAGIDLFILHEPLYLGSVLGSVLVILGLYLVLWGKREEAAAAAASAKPVQAEVEQQEKV